MNEAPAWLHVRVVPDRLLPTTGLEIVLTGSSQMPLGPRLAKGEPFPDWPVRFPVEGLAEAKAQATQWDIWLAKQFNPKLRVKDRGEDSPRVAAKTEEKAAF